MTRYDNMKFMGYNSEEEMDEAERRLEEIARKRIDAEKELKPDEKKSAGTKMTIDEAIKRYYKLAKEYTLDEFSFMEDKDSKKLAKEYEQVTEWLTELKEVKRLLKLAVEDFSFVSKNFISNMDSFCSMYNHIAGCVKDCPMSSSDDYGRCKWRYTDEALKLINDEK